MSTWPAAPPLHQGPCTCGSPADLTLLFLWTMSHPGLWRPVTRAAFSERLPAPSSSPPLQRHLLDEARGGGVNTGGGGRGAAGGRAASWASWRPPRPPPPPAPAAVDVGCGADGDVDFFFPFLVLYNSGRVRRFIGTDTVPVSTNPAIGVASRDVVLDDDAGLAVRIYLPSLTPNCSSAGTIDDAWAALRWALASARLLAAVRDLPAAAHLPSPRMASPPPRTSPLSGTSSPPRVASPPGLSTAACLAATAGGLHAVGLPSGRDRGREGGRDSDSLPLGIFADRRGVDGNPDCKRTKIPRLLDG